MILRLSKHVWAMKLALVTSQRSTCARRAVGCVLVDRDYYVISTGYNGPPVGLPHCTDAPCAGANSASGTDLGLCEAVHAEANALLRCHDPREIFAAFVTAQPCIHCIKMLMNTSCKEIYYHEEYPHRDAVDLWERYRSPMIRL